ncbi:MAG TPA: hypothetical protein VGC80_15025 [Acetobacteraceae bacterium]
MKAPAFRTTDVNTAPLDADVHVIEGVHDEFRLIWTALITAVDAEEPNDKVDALPAAMVLAAAGQMREALRAVQRAQTLDEVRAGVEQAIAAATGLS